jgi:protein O-mannosyl-transferase
VVEAARHPDSPRATYELGRTYVILSGYRPDSPNVEKAMAALETAARVPRASTLPEVALIMLASRTGRPIEPEWWASILRKLARRAPTVEDAGAIKSLTLCQREGRCALDDARMLEVYLAGVRSRSPDPAILYSYAIFAFNRLHDRDLALRLARDAARSSRDPQYSINLANFLIDLGEPEAAAEEIDRLRSRDHLGKLTEAIESLDRRLKAGQPRG